MMRKHIPALAAAIFAAASLIADEGQVCPSCECKCHTVSEGRDGYDANRQYYPYCSIYHDSRVKETENYDGPSWAARRTGSFSDEFIR